MGNFYGNPPNTNVTISLKTPSIILMVALEEKSEEQHKEYLYDVACVDNVLVIRPKDISVWTKWWIDQPFHRPALPSIEPFCQHG